MRLFPRLFFLLFLQVQFTISQETEIRKELYELHDSVIGYENLPLVNGVELIEKYRTINDKHQFFLDRDFLNGTVNYNGQTYYEVELKFDIFRDLLFMKLKENSRTMLMELIKEKVKEFTILEHSFKNLDLSGQPFESGFYEVILNDDKLKIYKRMKLKPAEKRDMRMLYYEFEKLDDEYVFYKPDAGYFEPKASVLNNKFPSCAKEIKEYSSTNKNSRRNSTDLYMVGLGRLLMKADCTEPSF